MEKRIEELERQVEMLILASATWVGEVQGSVFKENRGQLFKEAHKSLNEKVEKLRCKTCNRL